MKVFQLADKQITLTKLEHMFSTYSTTLVCLKQMWKAATRALIRFLTKTRAPTIFNMYVHSKHSTIPSYDNTSPICNFNTLCGTKLFLHRYLGYICTCVFLLSIASTMLVSLRLKATTCNTRLMKMRAIFRLYRLVGLCSSLSNVPQRYRKRNLLSFQTGRNELS